MRSRGPGDHVVCEITSTLCQLYKQVSLFNFSQNVLLSRKCNVFWNTPKMKSWFLDSNYIINQSVAIFYGLPVQLDDTWNNIDLIIEITILVTWHDQPYLDCNRSLGNKMLPIICFCLYKKFRMARETLIPVHRKIHQLRWEFTMKLTDIPKTKSSINFAKMFNYTRGSIPNSCV